MAGVKYDYMTCLASISLYGLGIVYFGNTKKAKHDFRHEMP
jgi:hypothetical protein